MRANKLTPGSNMIWSSSRMMLPEHVEGILQHRDKTNHRSKPTLDEQELERISLAVYASMQTRQPVTLRMFDPVEDLQLTGIVERVQGPRFRINGEWFNIEDIVGLIE